MNIWGRSANITIGKRYYDISDIVFSFEVPFEDSEEPPVSKITLFNLSEQTRKSIQKNEYVILNAGYCGDVGCILTGRIVGLKHKKSGNDWLSILTILTCAQNLLEKNVNKTYERNTRASDIVKDLLNMFGVEIVKCELESDQIYGRGKVCQGNLKKILSEIVVDDCKSRFMIRPTGHLFITKKNESVGMGVSIDSSVILQMNEEKIQIPSNLENGNNVSKEERCILKETFLNHRISTAERIQISSKSLNGIFYVVKGKHQGNAQGEWKTSIYLKPDIILQPRKIVHTVSESSRFEINDIVQFIGNKHFISSTSDRGSKCKSGEAKITSIAKKAKHPYHLIRTQGSKSSVYGWVNTSDIRRGE